MDKNHLKLIIRNLPFTKENFELLKEELIKSTFPKSISEQVENKMTNIEKNFQEDIIDNMDIGQSSKYEDNHLGKDSHHNWE